ncbi:MAG: hypothetical protein IPM56_03750 [Ignavibacteriales bacterium]|nr:MAG: hypothetical protein IPM56_03750 [Ignavibacteriales bacterium]
MDKFELRNKRVKDKDFQDFVINDKHLFELFAEHDLVGMIGSFGKEFTIQAVNKLLLNEKAELTSGRVPIYVCSECGDLACGGITISITKDDRYFTWDSFTYENNYEDKVLKEYKDIGPFNFSKEDYINILSQFVSSLNS